MEKEIELLFDGYMKMYDTNQELIKKMDTLLLHNQQLQAAIHQEGITNVQYMH